MARFRPPRDVPDLGLKPDQQARFNAWLRTAFVEIAEDLATLSRVDAGAQVAQETIDVAEGSLRRVTPPVGGMAVRVPPPSSGNAGATIRIMIEAPVGALTIVSRPGVGDDGKVFQPTINGQPRATFTASGLVVLTSNGASDWKTSAEFAAESAASARSSAATLGLGAEYHLASPNTLLPNARVADDSDEIDLDHSVPRVVTWFLKTASVALSKLADLMGLSVLGRAANSTGVMAAITASGARQALLSNSAGTAIGWRSIEGADLPSASPYGWDDVLAEDPSSGANNPSIASGQHLAFAGGGLALGDVRGALGLRLRATAGNLVAVAAGNADVSAAGNATLSASGGAFVTATSSIALTSGQATTLSTGGAQRVIWSVDGTWRLGTGSGDPGTAGQVITSAGVGAPPTWADVDLSSVTYTAGDGIDLAANEFSLNGAEAGEIIRFSTQEDGPNTTGTYEPTIDAETTIYRINPAAGDTITFTGFEFVGGNSGKKFLLLKQGGDGSVVVKHNAGATSTNGAFTPFEVDYVLAGANTACIVWYQTSSARWNIASVTFANGDGLDLSGNTFSVDVSDFAGAGIEDDGSNNLRIAAAAAGDGLTGGGGSALAVGAGTGITVNANDVAVNTGAAFSWTGNHTWSVGDISFDVPIFGVSANDVGISSTNDLDLDSDGNVVVDADALLLSPDGFLIFDAASASTPSLTAQQGMFWVAPSSASGETLPRYTDSTNADRYVLLSFDKFRTSSATGAIGTDALDDDHNVWRWSGGAGANLSGLSGDLYNGRCVLVRNASSTQTLTLNHQSAATASHGFLLPNNANVAVRPRGGYWLVYDTTSSRWYSTSP